MINRARSRLFGGVMAMVVAAGDGRAQELSPLLREALEA